MPASLQVASSTPEQILDQSAEELEQVQKQLKEIELLIGQTTAEVDRLAQRNTQVTNRLRQLEATLDTVPREDLKEAYTAVLETQQRLFTMRGQLEKLQSDQSNMERYRDLLRAASGRAGDFAAAEEPDDSEPVKPLVVRIIEAQERERQRLSQQVHDGPAQALTNLILQAEICERLFQTDPEKARAELVSLKEAVASTFQAVKGFIINLRPMMLDDLGVVPTLRRYVEGFSENSGVVTRLTVTGKDRRLADHKEVTVFRLVQELVNNAVELGGASSVQIDIDVGAEQVRVAVEDNGSGYDLGGAAASTDSERLGLATMRERVEMLGGTIEFDSQVGRGTKASFQLPVG
jgi:two-component system sensor histidine kinase DegS